MFTLEQLLAEQTRAVEALAALRTADTIDTAALLAQSATVAAIREEVSVARSLELPTGAPAAAPAVAPTAWFRDAAITELAANMRAGRPGAITVGVETRDVFVGDTAAGAAAGALNIVTPEYSAGIDALRLPALSLLDLMPVRNTSSDTMVVYVQTGFTNNAATKPKRNAGNDNFAKYNESDITIAPRRYSVVRVGHYFHTDKDSLADAPQVETLLRTDGVYGVRAELQRQLLTPTQVAGDLPSIVADPAVQTVTYSAAGDANADARALLDAISAAQVAAEVAQYPADFVALSPAAVGALRVMKNADGDYQFGSPFGAGSLGRGGTIFGLTVVVERSLGGTAVNGGLDRVIVGSTAAYQLWTRTGIEVSMSENVDDDFLREAIRIKVAGRWIGALVRPESFVIVTAAAA